MSITLSIDHPPDGPTGFTAADGSYIPIPPLPVLDDGPPPDLSDLAAAFCNEGVQQAEQAFFVIARTIETELDHLDNPYFEDQLNDAQKVAFSKASCAGLDAIAEARATKADRARSGAGAVIATLADPESARTFKRVALDQMGAEFVARLHWRLTELKAQGSCLPEVFARLSERTRIAALSGLLRHLPPPRHSQTLLGQIALEFLNGPHGDLRHLVPHDISVPDPAALRSWITPPSEARAHYAFNPNFDRGPIFLHEGAEWDETVQRETTRLIWPTNARSENGHWQHQIPSTLADYRNAAKCMTPEAFIWHFIASPSSGGLTQIPPAAAWPYIASNFATLDKVLLDDPKPGKTAVKNAITCLEVLPKLPMRYKDVVYRSAMRTSTSGKKAVQRSLSGDATLIRRLTKDIADRNPGKRQRAVVLLGKSGHKAAIEPLTDLLRTETELLVRDAALSSLATLGGSLAPYDLDRHDILRESEELSKTPYCEDQGWLHDLDPPVLRFTDGNEAPINVSYGLVALASQLQSVHAGATLNLWRKHFGAPSLKALGAFLLDAWIAHDVLRWTDIPETEYEARFIDEMYSLYTMVVHFRYPGWEEDQADEPEPPSFMPKPEFARTRTKDDYQAFIRDKMRWQPYLGSSYQARGVLALTDTVPTPRLIKIVQAYLADHGRRLPQAKLLIEMVFARKGTSAEAMIETVATQQQQASLRSHARALRKGNMP